MATHKVGPDACTELYRKTLNWEKIWSHWESLDPSVVVDGGCDEWILKFLGVGNDISGCNWAADLLE